MRNHTLRGSLRLFTVISLLCITAASFASDDIPKGPTTSFEALYVHRFNQDLSDTVEFSAG